MSPIQRGSVWADDWDSKMNLSQFSKMTQEEDDYQTDDKDPPEQLQQLEVEPLRTQHHKYRSLSRILLLIGNISLSSFYFGYMIIYLSVIDFTVVTNIFNITIQRSVAQGLITSCVPIGGLIGAYVSSYFLKHFSRRETLIYVNYVAFVLGILIFWADFGFYMLLRLGQGMCAGIFSSVVPLIIKELAPFELSGFFGVFHQLFITIGIFLCCILTYILSLITHDNTGESYWKIIFAFPLCTIALQTVCLNSIYRFQTPRYLIDHHQEDKARQLLGFLYYPQHIEQMLRELKEENSKSDGSTENRSSSSSGINKQLTITKKVAIHLALLQQFVGISAVATYARAIAQGSLSDFKPILPSILNFEQVASAVLSSFLLTKYGRKTILQVGTLGAAVANLVIAFGYFLNSSHPSLSVALILMALFYYMANFGLSLGPIVWMYIPEIVAPDFLPFSTMVNWGGSAATILLFPIIKAKLPGENPGPLFLFFAIWSGVSYVLNKKFVLQTRNKTSRQIQEEYRQLQSL